MDAAIVTQARGRIHVRLVSTTHRAEHVDQYHTIFRVYILLKFNL